MSWPRRAYFQTTNPLQRQALRDLIIYARLAAYDIEFQNFQADLNKEANLGNLSGDFAVLTLTGLGATTGGVATKAALSAAAAGVTGATAHFNKDIFFNQALPAVLAQMSASRAAALSDIKNGLAQDDQQYPLSSALLDLNRYREAGSLPSALHILTANANVIKAAIVARVSPVSVARPAAARALTTAAQPTSMFLNSDALLYLNLP